jgi:hypothetical protein
MLFVCRSFQAAAALAKNHLVAAPAASPPRSQATAAAACQVTTAACALKLVVHEIALIYLDLALQDSRSNEIYLCLCRVDVWVTQASSCLFAKSRYGASYCYYSLMRSVFPRFRRRYIKIFL